MYTVKNNLETIVFPLTMKQNKILKQFQQIWTPWEVMYDFYDNQRRLIFCCSERVNNFFNLMYILSLFVNIFLIVYPSAYSMHYCTVIEGIQS